MSSTLACVVCSLDPQTTSLVLPIAQAAIVAAPVILRDEIRKGLNSVRARRASGRAVDIDCAARDEVHAPSGGRASRTVEPDR